LPRVFILGLDGCDYRLVDLFGLKELKQAKSGHFPSLIDNRIGSPMSPQVWASFITGTPQTQIQGWRHFNRFGKYERILNMFQITPHLGLVLRKLMFRFIHLVPKNVPLQMFLTDFLSRHRYVGKQDLVGPTLFDVVKSSVAVRVPVWNLSSEHSVMMLTNMLANIPLWESLLWLSTRETFKECLGVTGGDWSLAMGYIELLDSVGHVYPSSYGKQTEAYRSVTDFVAELKAALPKDVLLLIVSDHGMEQNGLHSHECFWSMSQNHDFEPHSITDFYTFILGEVGCV